MNQKATSQGHMQIRKL